MSGNVMSWFVIGWFGRAYVILGAVFAATYDLLEMSRPVPYSGYALHGARLRTLRQFCAVVITLFWLPLLGSVLVRRLGRLR